MTIRHDGMTLSTHFCPSDEKYVRQTVLPCVTRNGKQVSYQRFMVACHNARLEGLEAFPRDGCTNYDKRTGACLGCDAPGNVGGTR
jgi:hypothetical protein